jgi:hypothetical protein
MARGRRLDALQADAYKRSDNEGAIDRHPLADVTRYINQGRAERYDLLVEARGRQYFRKNPPHSITTLSTTTRYALNPDFYRLISVRRACDAPDLLVPFRAEQEPDLRMVSGMPWPTHYELQNGFIELLPAHQAGVCIVVDYVPVITDLVNASDESDGINGWEEYDVCFAARCMAVKDEEWELVRALDADMARIKERISKLAPTQDTFRAERVKDVRGTGMFGYGRRW